MAILNPEHLFDQAVRLASTSSAGAPRQADVRRAFSSVYYGVFHFVLIALADEFAGKGMRGTTRYELIYRSLDHGTLRSLCRDLSKGSLSPKFRAYAPTGGFGPDLEAFATVVIDLQDKRHLADYGHLVRFRASDARSAIGTARSALSRFNRASPEQRATFLTLLLCQPR